MVCLNASLPLAKCESSGSGGQDFYCCPEDDTCDCLDGKNAIQRGASQPTTVTVIKATSWLGMSSTTTTTSSSSTKSTTSASALAITLSKLSASSSSTTHSPTPTANPPQQKSNSGSVLAAGLGGGLGGAALLALLVGLFLWFHRRSQRKTLSSATSDTGMQETFVQPQASMGGGSSTSAAYYEADHTGAVFEAPYNAQRAKNQRNELDGNYNSPVEMDNSSYANSGLSSHTPVSPPIVSPDALTHRLG
ncbi:hypothetical protein NA57DRAFT_73536 [Rhizodiscina lignyota]|uniref:Extracellular membrane protein CFEM domain-containing protein n=1 Tax=Rhizodiscina lignyota TaxID=1504668 RepID=A0A9P4MDY8_9PEZI|nr:hypothetical protein NA57DRAFT_73536 [Rhizodiscina lignyota]